MDMCVNNIMYPLFSMLNFDLCLEFCKVEKVEHRGILGVSYASDSINSFWMFCLDFVNFINTYTVSFRYLVG